MDALTSNLSYNPPARTGLDDVTGEPLEQRDDDNPDTFRQRIASFHQKTEPMIDFLRTVQYPPHSGTPLLADLTGSTSDEIWPKLQKTILARFPYLADGDK